MPPVPPSRWILVLVLSAAVGLAVGVAPAQQWLIARGMNPGPLNFLLVNVGLPVLALAMGVLYPRVRVAALAGLCLGLSFWLGRLLGRNFEVWRWSADFVRSATHPILAAAIPAYAILAGVSAAIVGAFRRVDLPDAHLRCPACGYLRIGDTASFCPECGRPGSPRGA